jgi:hypothetical protein
MSCNFTRDSEPISRRTIRIYEKELLDMMLLVTACGPYIKVISGEKVTPQLDMSRSLDRLHPLNMQALAC